MTDHRSPNVEPPPQVTPENENVPGLQRIEERFRLLMQCVQDHAIVFMDPEGRVVDWNAGAAHLLGYQAEIIGQPFSIFFTPEETHNGVPDQELKRAVDTGRSGDDRWHVRKDGTYFFASGVTAALRDHTGCLRGFVKIFRDNTERKRLEEELRCRAEASVETDRRKDEFLAMLAHELRNPLAPIVHALHILSRDNADRSLEQQARAVIGRQVAQLTSLVDDLLDVSRITRGKIQLAKKPVQLRDIVDNAVQTARPLLDARGHEWNVTLPPEPIWLEADGARLEQVFANLLNNAAKYTEDGGKISLTAQRHGNEAVIRVQDTGQGITADMIPHIFDLFTQEQRFPDRSQGGLGIGLTLARRLVELHGGHVEAASGGVGLGSEFTVRLPLSGGAVPASLEVKPGNGAPAVRPLRLLVVEDSDDSAQMLGQFLRLDGHEVHTAHCGTTGLEAARRLRPDVILLDIGLPGLDGYQVAQRLRQQPDMRHMVLVAVSGYGQEADIRRSHEAGFDYHLVKPVNPVRLEEFLAALGNHTKEKAVWRLGDGRVPR